MEQDKRLVFVKTLDAISGGERETKWALNANTEVLDEREISLDGVGVAIDGGDVLIKKTALLRARRSCHKILEDD
jgi:hypothetical protein